MEFTITISTMKIISLIISLTIINNNIMFSQTPVKEINGIKIYKSISNGLVFYNFKLKLTKDDFLLPNDPIIIKHLGLSRNPDNYRNNILDDQSNNFISYGQFEIYIPANRFPLTDYKTGYIILRMAQTLNWDENYNKIDITDKLKDKKELYRRLVKLKEDDGKNDFVEVTVEFPNTNSFKIERNIYFRHAHGEYINKVGQL
jgi:hypothetical protein